MIRLSSSHKPFQRHLIRYVSRTRDHVHARLTHTQGSLSDGHHLVPVDCLRNFLESALLLADRSGGYQTKAPSKSRKNSHEGPERCRHDSDTKFRAALVRRNHVLNMRRGTMPDHAWTDRGQRLPRGGTSDVSQDDEAESIGHHGALHSSKTYYTSSLSLLLWLCVATATPCEQSLSTINGKSRMLDCLAEHKSSRRSTTEVPCAFNLFQGGLIMIDRSPSSDALC